MGYLTTLRTLKKLIFLSGHFLLICSIRSQLNFGSVISCQLKDVNNELKILNGLKHFF